MVSKETLRAFNDKGYKLENVFSYAGDNPNQLERTMNVLHDDEHVMMIQESDDGSFTALEFQRVTPNLTLEEVLKIAVKNLRREQNEIINL